MKKYQAFFLKIFSFMEVESSIYLNKSVFFFNVKIIMEQIFSNNIWSVP